LATIQQCSRGGVKVARHVFQFLGGEDITTLGATWFVSYLFYIMRVKNHINWKNVTTYTSRISTFNRTSKYHTFWLKQISNMKDSNLEKNTLELSAVQIKKMAAELLQLKI
jgi:hypothetical protein